MKPGLALFAQFLGVFVVVLLVLSAIDPIGIGDPFASRLPPYSAIAFLSGGALVMIARAIKSKGQQPPN